MVYTCTYKSLLGDMLLSADETGLTGVWFEGQKYFANTLPVERVSQETKILTEAKKWLDVYFSGKVYTATSPCRISIQTSCVADFITDSLWRNNYIWRNCQTTN